MRARGTGKKRGCSFHFLDFRNFLQFVGQNGDDSGKKSQEKNILKGCLGQAYILSFLTFV